MDDDLLIYRDLAEASRRSDGEIDTAAFERRLSDLAADDYRHRFPNPRLTEFTHGPAAYLFDAAGGEAGPDRTLLASGRPAAPGSARDEGYQRGFPLVERYHGRTVDRGHFIPYTAGGLYGPNLFVQDRALNRGWSKEGRAYRSLERLATDNSPASWMFVHAHYADDTDVPRLLTLGVVTGSGLSVGRFRNRYDDLTRDALELRLPGAVDAQIGELGEETAFGLLEGLGATIVSAGDGGSERDGGRQSLDLIVVRAGVLAAIEVKTRYSAAAAGRLTRSGDLPRPRLRRPSDPTRHRQGSQPYVAERIGDHVAVDDADYLGMDVLVVAVDLVAMKAQLFAVNDSGTRLAPASPVLDCADEARAASARVLEHRGAW